MQNVFDVDMRRKKGVRIGAAGLDGLEQEIRTLLSTRKGSVPLDRDFGLTWQYVDLPMPEAMPYMIAEIARQLENMCRASRCATSDSRATTRWKESCSPQSRWK